MSGLIVHEWLAQHGGAESVVRQMMLAFPDARVRCLWNDAPATFDPAIVQESWLARTPLRFSKLAAAPLMPMTWRSLRSREQVDWLLVSSHLFAHHARLSGPNRDVPKLVYAHTPARYVWAPQLDGRGRSLPARATSALIKPVDRWRSREAHAIAANSEFVQRRVNETWGREATVIYPPVSVDEIAEFVSGGMQELADSDLEQLERLPDAFILGASRFVPYKNLDKVIRIANAINIPAVIAGGGSGAGALHRLAADSRVPVHIIDRPKSQLLWAIYARALAYLFPPIEDFGIMPVEAMAAGCPIVVHLEGGASESARRSVGAAVTDFEDEATAAADVMGLIESGKRPSPVEISEFSEATFRTRVSGWVQENVS